MSLYNLAYILQLRGARACNLQPLDGAVELYRGVRGRGPRSPGRRRALPASPRQDGERARSMQRRQDAPPPSPPLKSAPSAAAPRRVAQAPRAGWIGSRGQRSSYPRGNAADHVGLYGPRRAPRIRGGGRCAQIVERLVEAGGEAVRASSEGAAFAVLGRRRSDRLDRLTFASMLLLVTRTRISASTAWPRPQG